LTEFRKII